MYAAIRDSRGRRVDDGESINEYQSFTFNNIDLAEKFVRNYKPISTQEHWHICVIKEEDSSGDLLLWNQTNMVCYGLWDSEEKVKDFMHEHYLKHEVSMEYTHIMRVGKVLNLFSSKAI
jgi:hypothetical protein